MTDLHEPPQFVVVYQDGTLALKEGTDISRMFDLDDCDSMEGVKEILSVNQNGELVPVTVETSRRRNDSEEEYPLVYAYSAIRAGFRHVGTVAWTDH